MNSSPTMPPNIFKKVFEAVIHVLQRVQIAIRQRNQIKSEIAFMLLNLDVTLESTFIKKGDR